MSGLVTCANKTCKINLLQERIFVGHRLHVDPVQPVPHLQHGVVKDVVLEHFTAK